MRTRVAVLLAAALFFAASAPGVRAQEDDPEEIQKVAGPFQEATKAIQAKDYPKAIAAYERFFGKLEKAKLSETTKKNAERGARYNYACALALTGKKDDAIKAFARSVELGFWDWKHIDEDNDLDSIRNEDAFKKAIESGKAAQKVQQEKEAQEASEATKKALAADPLFELDFEAKTIDGKTVKLSDLKGKVVIVDVWGTWCPPCRAEIPHFVRLSQAYKQDGLEIVGLAWERDKDAASALEDVKKFVAKQKMQYPVALLEQESSILSKIPDLNAFPTTIFVDREGKVRVREVGYRDYAVLEAVAKTLLEAKK